MKAITRVIAMLLLGIVLAVGALGCNTFRGVGRDIQHGGQAIENAAEDVQNR